MHQETPEPDAAESVFPQIYDELRRLAGGLLADERPGQTLNATALVNEAYLRLAQSAQRTNQPGNPEYWHDRRRFFCAAAEAMRRILVDSARRKRTRKHGGGRVRADVDLHELPQLDDVPDVEALDEALNELTKTDEQAAELVKLRYFGGMTIPEAAQLMGISARTADSIWAYGRAWLRTRLME